MNCLVTWSPVVIGLLLCMGWVKFSHWHASFIPNHWQGPGVYIIYTLAPWIMIFNTILSSPCSTAPIPLVSFLLIVDDSSYSHSYLVTVYSVPRLVTSRFCRTWTKNKWWLCSSFQGPQAFYGSVWSYLLNRSPLLTRSLLEHCTRPGREATLFHNNIFPVGCQCTRPMRMVWPWTSAWSNTAIPCHIQSKLTTIRLVGSSRTWTSRSS